MPRKSPASVSAAPLPERTTTIIKAATKLIAERGFEGLRVREVASLAHLNHATLLYYFPDKEALIEGVANALISGFTDYGLTRDATRQTASGSVAQGPAAGAALVALRAHLTDIRTRLRESPEVFIVLHELRLRGLRDTAIRRLMDAYQKRWEKNVATLFRAGVADGTFAPTLDPKRMTSALIAQVLGASTTVTLASSDKAMAALLYWLQAATSWQRVLP